MVVFYLPCTPDTGEKKEANMRNWKAAYTNAVDSLLAKGIKAVTPENLQTKLEEMNPDFRPGSQGPSDFIGIRGTDGKITRPLSRTGSVSPWRLNYPTLYTVTDGKYQFILPAERLLAVGTSTISTPKTRDERIAELRKLEAEAEAEAKKTPKAGK